MPLTRKWSLWALEAAAIVGIIICVILIAVLVMGHFFKRVKPHKWAADNPLKPQGEASGV
jgi:hypothetical protein